MPPSKEMIGRVLSTGSATVDGAHVAAFAAALGDANPEYSTLAPPTYPIAFMAQSMAGAASSFDELGLNFMTLVHGEQEFEYQRPVMAGETLTLTARIADVSEKQARSGILDILVLATEATDAAGKPVFASRQTLVSRRM